MDKRKLQQEKIAFNLGVLTGPSELVNDAIWLVFMLKIFIY